MYLSGALGAVAMPSAMLFESRSEISRRCEAYAREKAGDDLIAGKASSLTQLQADIDACADRLDVGRQLLQALVLTVGLVGAAYAGKQIWRKS